MIIGCFLSLIDFWSRRFVVFIKAGFNRGSACILRENQVHNHSVVCFSLIWLSRQFWLDVRFKYLHDRLSMKSICSRLPAEKVISSIFLMILTKSKHVFYAKFWWRKMCSKARKTVASLLNLEVLHLAVKMLGHCQFSATFAKPV